MNELSQLHVNMNVSEASGGRARRGETSWFEAMAEAWGKALDAQANRITTQADQLISGNETPLQVTMLTAESLRMQFLSNASHTALASTGSALETMARKQ